MTHGKNSIRWAFFSVFLLVFGTPVARAPAQGIERVGAFGDWSSFRFTEDGKPACYMASQPIKAQGNYKKRGEIYAIVTHRPAENRRDEVSIVAGYQYKKDSRVEVIIGGKTYKLFTQEDGAWAPDKESDKALVRAMIKGRTMVVKGTSSRGTRTTDTYSLSGFTRAYHAINKACGL
ncbi:MAG: invasion associated locus B family protein [Kiloniellaceae bacterium]